MGLRLRLVINNFGATLQKDSISGPVAIWQYCGLIQQPTRIEPTELSSPVVFPTSLFTNEEQEKISELLETWSQDQKLWLSGLLASGGAAATEASPGQPEKSQTELAGYTILYGSETGNCESIAQDLHQTLSAKGLPGRVLSMGDYRFRALKKERFLLIACSTHGDGEPPYPAMDFFESLMDGRAQKLPDLAYAVLALGDSSYEFFCKAGVDLDMRLGELGASRLADRLECDIDFDSDASRWLEEIVTLMVGKLASAETRIAGSGLSPVQAETAIGKKTHSRNNPFSAQVLANVRLNGRNSDKSTRHLEVDLAGSGIAYLSGDSLGVLPRNPANEIASLLEAAGFHGSEAVKFRDGIAPLEDMLVSSVEIQRLTVKALRRWAELANSDDLSSIAADPGRLGDFLEGNHLVDLVRLFPVTNLSPQQFIDLMVPLQPRYYSIASSMAIAEEEAHLVVTQLNYELNGLVRYGVASNHLADEEQGQLDVYLHPNPRFRLPEDDMTPIIMVGAGTGVAPYRAFLQEREARDAKGDNWLFFGDRRFHEDFLYQTDWQRWHKEGLLSRIDLAFSRDGEEKRYVQGRLIEKGQQVYEWLEAGAHFYVCGDAERMAKGVDKALSFIVAKHGGMQPPDAGAYLKMLERESRLQRDVY